MELLETQYQRNIDGVEIFASGTHTDSSGVTRTWTREDLDTMIRQSKDSDDPIPLKVGHSSDTFNQKLADELGVPAGILTGEEGRGAARLGLVTNLRRDDDKLVADFVNVPDPLADLIDTSQFNAVSVEIEMDEEENPILSATALLGAELPAVGNLAPLTANLSAPNPNSSWISLSFQEGTLDLDELTAEFNDIQAKFEEIIRGKKGARIFRSLASMLSDRFNNMVGRSRNQAPILSQGAEDGRPPKAWWDRALTAARAYQIPNPSEFAGSIWFNNDPIPRTSFDTPESSIQATAALHAIIGQWVAAHSDTPSVPEGKPTEHDHNHSEGDNMVMQPQGIQDPNNAPLSTPDQQNFVLAPEDLPALYEKLGLPDTATIEDVLAAIDALASGGAPPAEMPPEEAPMSAPNPAIADLQKQVKSQGEYIKQLEHEKTVTAYTKQVEGLVTVSDPGELAEELAHTRETIGEAAATRLLASYQKANAAAEEGGLLQSLGTSRRTAPGAWDDDTDPVHKEIEEYAREEGISFNKALAAFAVKHPEKFREYKRRVEDSVYSRS